MVDDIDWGFAFIDVIKAIVCKAVLGENKVGHFIGRRNCTQLQRGIGPLAMKVFLAPG